jgi:hypothetical protein
MANPGCHLPSGWNMLDAAPAYSAFAGILGGFLFLGIVTLMTERRYPDSSNQASVDTGNGARAQADKKMVNRSRTLMLFLPAFLSLVVSSFLFGEVSGEQVCARGYVGGIFASSLLAVGALGVFSGIGWMLDAYGESDEDLRLTSAIFTYISYFIVIVSLLASSVDFIKDTFDNKPPAYALGPVIAYGPLLMISVAATRKWFMPTEHGRPQAQLAAVYFPVAYMVVMAIILSVLNSYGPAEWRSLNDWKVYLALSVTLFFPAVTMIVYTRSLPDVHRKKTSAPATT